MAQPSSLTEAESRTPESANSTSLRPRHPSTLLVLGPPIGHRAPAASRHLPQQTRSAARVDELRFRRWHATRSGPGWSSPRRVTVAAPLGPSPTPGSLFFDALARVTVGASAVTIIAAILVWLTAAVLLLAAPLATRSTWPERSSRAALALVVAATGLSALHDPRREALLALLPYAEMTVIFAVIQALKPSSTEASRAAAVIAFLTAASVLFDAVSGHRAFSMRAPGGFAGNRNVAGEIIARSPSRWRCRGLPSRLAAHRQLSGGCFYSWSRPRSP